MTSPSDQLRDKVARIIDSWCSVNVVTRNALADEMIRIVVEHIAKTLEKTEKSAFDMGFKTTVQICREDILALLPNETKGKT